MKFTPTLFLGSFGALAATLALAQETPGDAGATTVPLRPLLHPQLEPSGEGSGGSAVDPSMATDSIDLVVRLTVADLDAREAAFDEIARRAAQDSEVRRELRELANDTADPDLAFTARLALRESDRLSTWGRVGSGFGGRALQTPNDPFDSMRRQMESIFGSDPFANDFFTNDPFFSRPFGGRNGTLRLDPFAGGGDPFENLQRRVDEIRKQFEASRGGRQRHVDPDVDVDSQSVRSSISMSMTPGGVRVEVTEDDGTGPSTEVYEAESLDALLEAHPELKGRIR